MESTQHPELPPEKHPLDLPPPVRLKREDQRPTYEGRHAVDKAMADKSARIFADYAHQQEEAAQSGRQSAAQSSARVSDMARRRAAWPSTGS
jgi:hypothetical protein